MLYRIILGAALIAASQLDSAHAQDPNDATRKAYDYAQRCFVATSVVHDNAGAKLAFDAAMKLGRILGYDNRHLNSDFANGQELVKMARNDAYRRQTLRDCARIGLAS